MRRVQFWTLGLNSLLFSTFFHMEVRSLKLIYVTRPTKISSSVENTYWLQTLPREYMMSKDSSYVGVEPRSNRSQTSVLTIKLSPTGLNSLYLVSNLWSKHIINLLLALNLFSKITCIYIQIEPLLHKTRIQDHDCNNNLKF